MQRLTTWVMVIGMSLGAAIGADAQVRLAPEIVFAEDVDFGIGARAFFPVLPNLEIGAYFDYFFVSGAVGYSELGGTGYYLFPLASNPHIVPKVGAGITLGFVSLDRETSTTASSTELGVHLLGGLEFPMNSIQPFIEGGAGLSSEIPAYFIRAGVGFKLGGG